MIRPPMYHLYRMKTDRLPEGTRSAWLRTWPDKPPPAPDDWVFVGKERYPSRWTIAEMNEKGSCYREIPSWIGRASTRRDTQAVDESAH
jgi:hypothetical protein